ncbi:SusC/RagA family TonB-linked outer membrane protein [Pedobacter antarcticus]|uniref:SusC/RagA family TonB-linked outer membrane protein n=1 Tax=Pedobacter antarcticus TaxID=34086 RepID=UPI00292FB2E2|nr:SusC/RagA family TonB-linked outer membrane protein [Pedobacter antarcticus]
MNFYTCYRYAYVRLAEHLNKHYLRDISLFLLLIISLNVSANTREQTISLNIRNANLKQVFKLIEKQSKYGFWYDENQLGLASPVNAEIENATLKEALDLCLKNQPFSYELVEQTVVVRLKSGTAATKERVPEIQKDIIIKGKVTDQRGQAIPGVSIKLKGSARGIVANGDGSFSFEVPEGNSTLIFSMVGFDSKEVSVNARTTTLNVKLDETNSTLDEVVVSGLASTVKRKNLANAISSVSAKDITGVTRPQTTDGALYGKVAGASIKSNGGAPGGGVSIQLRGFSSLIGASQPLIILDGVYINNSFQSTGRATVTGAGNTNQDDGSNRLADINPDEIENMEILKGPSAAAIYGTRANAGVIIITTKKGKSGKTAISFSEDIGLTTPLKMLGQDPWSEDKINYFYAGTSAAQTARRNLELERFKNAQSTGNFIDYEDYFYNHRRISTNTRLNISGGSENTQYFLGAGMSKENGLLENTGFDRYSIRANVDQKIGKFIQLSVNSNFIRSNTDRGFTGNQNRSGASVGYGIAYTPNYFNLKKNADGTYPDNPYFTENPIALTDKGVNNSLVNRFIQSFNLGINLFSTDNSFAKIQINGGLDYLQNTTNIYLPEDLQYQRGLANPGDILNGKQESFNTNLQAAFVYNWKIGKLGLNSQAGLVRLDSRNDLAFIRGQGLAPQQRNIKQAAIQTVQNQLFEKIQEAGIFAQQEANFDDKFIATLGVRFDKSSLNGDENKFYAFPKASLAVNLTNFNLFETKVISQLKPRIAYGETAGPVSFSSIYTPLVGTNIGGLLGSASSATYGNSLLRPETAKELEMGLDIGVFDNLLSLEATYYIKNTSNNIQVLSLSPASGVTSIPSNLAALKNTGIELSLSARIIEKPNFKWNARAMYWSNKVIVSKLDIPSYTIGGFGSAYGTFLIKEGEKLGTIVGTPQISPGVFTVWGNSQPDFTASLSNSINFYKNFDLSFLFEWKKGGDNINMSTTTTDEGGTTKGWFGDDNGDGIPNGKQREPAPYNNAGRFVEDASYIKLRELGLYYTMPTAITNKLFKNNVKRFKVGISGNNLLMFTKYSGYDPEASNFGAGLANNIEVNPYPSARRMFFNLSLDF